MHMCTIISLYIDSKVESSHCLLRVKDWTSLQTAKCAQNKSRWGQTSELSNFKSFERVVIWLFVTLTSESVDEILLCYHSNVISLAESLHSAIFLIGFRNYLKIFCEISFNHH